MIDRRVLHLVLRPSVADVDLDVNEILRHLFFMPRTALADSCTISCRLQSTSDLTVHGHCIDCARRPTCRNGLVALQKLPAGTRSALHVQASPASSITAFRCSATRKTSSSNSNSSRNNSTENNVGVFFIGESSDMTTIIIKSDSNEAEPLVGSILPCHDRMPRMLYPSSWTCSMFGTFRVFMAIWTKTQGREVLPCHDHYHSTGHSSTHEEVTIRTPVGAFDENKMNPNLMHIIK
jgi:hypothetical protein